MGCMIHEMPYTSCASPLVLMVYMVVLLAVGAVSEGLRAPPDPRILGPPPLPPWRTAYPDNNCPGIRAMNDFTTVAPSSPRPTSHAPPTANATVRQPSTNAASIAPDNGGYDITSVTSTYNSTQLMSGEAVTTKQKMSVSTIALVIVCILLVFCVVISLVIFCVYKKKLSQPKCSYDTKSARIMCERHIGEKNFLHNYQVRGWKWNRGAASDSNSMGGGEYKQRRLSESSCSTTGHIYASIRNFKNFYSDSSGLGSELPSAMSGRIDPPDGSSASLFDEDTSNRGLTKEIIARKYCIKERPVTSGSDETERGMEMLPILHPLKTSVNDSDTSTTMQSDNTPLQQRRRSSAGCRNSEMSPGGGRVPDILSNISADSTATQSPAKQRRRRKHRHGKHRPRHEDELMSNAYDPYRNSGSLPYRSTRHTNGLPDVEHRSTSKPREEVEQSDIPDQRISLDGNWCLKPASTEHRISDRTNNKHHKNPNQYVPNGDMYDSTLPPRAPPPRVPPTHATPPPPAPPPASGRPRKPRGSSRYKRQQQLYPEDSLSRQPLHMQESDGSKLPTDRSASPTYKYRIPVDKYYIQASDA